MSRIPQIFGDGPTCSGPLLPIIASDLGSDYYAKRLDTAPHRNLVGQLEALGHRVPLTPAA